MGTWASSIGRGEPRERIFPTEKPLKRPVMSGKSGRFTRIVEFIRVACQSGMVLPVRVCLGCRGRSSTSGSRSGRRPETLAMTFCRGSRFGQHDAIEGHLDR